MKLGYKDAASNSRNENDRGGGLRIMKNVIKAHDKKVSRQESQARVSDFISEWVSEHRMIAGRRLDIR